MNSQKEYNISKITKEKYKVADHVFFRNTLQSAFYVKKGAKLVDIFVDPHTHFVYVFSRKDHDRIKLLWKNSMIEKN